MPRHKMDSYDTEKQGAEIRVTAPPRWAKRQFRLTKYRWGDSLNDRQRVQFICLIRANAFAAST